MGKKRDDLQQQYDDLWNLHEELSAVCFNRGALLMDIFEKYPNIREEFDPIGIEPPTPTVAAQQCGLDERSLDTACEAYDKEWLATELHSKATAAAIESLSAQCAQPQAGEAVAWRYKLYATDADWTVSTIKPKGAIVEPLYASPQPANPAQEKLGRFSHHPDPAIDFEIEVESLQARLIDAKGGISKPGTEPETVASVLEDIRRAMTFIVGGDPITVAAKSTLRELEKEAQPANPAQGVREALSDCLDMLARFTHSTSNDLNHVEARAVYRAGRAALAAIDIAPKPPGWPDPLESPQAEAIRNGKVDDTEIRNLFDCMERELRLHRERAVNPAQVTELPRVNGRDIYEVANQLEGYVDEGTPEKLAQFLLREGKAAADLADEIVRLTAAIGAGGQAVADAWDRPIEEISRIKAGKFFDGAPNYKPIVAGDREKFIDENWSSWREDAIAEVSALSQPHPADESWRDDPSADERWNAGLDYGQTQLCKVLGVDPASINWDAATETLDGDVQSVIGKILTARFGEDWQSAHPADDRVVEVLREARELLAGPLVGVEWKRACHSFVAKADAALSAKEGRKNG